MIVKAGRIGSMLEDRSSPDPLVIAPRPLIQKGSASVDLRLGCWFATLRGTRLTVLDVVKEDGPRQKESALTKMHFVRFGEAFILHPRSFVLGVTLEWMRLPANLGGYVTSRSSWGRRGLIIATAVGVHPGFTGCLTLELSNVGEIPIMLYPGMNVCHFFFHRVAPKTEDVDRSKLIGKRKPYLNTISPDEYFQKLAGFAVSAGAPE
jgi:dCTP deaminase